MDHPTVDAAVLAVRARLHAQGVTGEDAWRNVIAADPLTGWTVQTWTAAPSDPNGPQGPPDYVHHVWSDHHSGPAPQVEQVFPGHPGDQPVRRDGGGERRTEVSRHLTHVDPDALLDPAPWPAREDLLPDHESTDEPDVTGEPG